jgi:hypothetical protein
MANFGSAECANPDCGIAFVKKASNAIYCSSDCRTTIMNKRILARYHERKNRLKNNEKRYCAGKSCDNILSRYNTDRICELCKEKRLDDRLKRWGWSDGQINKWRNS